MRIVVIGGAGNFGARVCRALALDPSLDVIAAGRKPASPGPSRSTPPAVGAAQIDIAVRDFEASLRAKKPAIVIHCAGPFQGQDYRVAQVALACGAHYLDLANGRQFVAGFANALDDVAVAQDTSRSPATHRTRPRFLRRSHSCSSAWSGLELTSIRGSLAVC